MPSKSPLAQSYSDKKRSVETRIDEPQAQLVGERDIRSRRDGGPV